MSSLLGLLLILYNEKLVFFKFCTIKSNSKTCIVLDIGHVTVAILSIVDVFSIVLNNISFFTCNICLHCLGVFSGSKYYGQFALVIPHHKYVNVNENCPIANS